jgi:hypothetical protein
MELTEARQKTGACGKSRRRKKPMADYEECSHPRYKVDAFMRDLKAKRATPGNTICAECGEPLPYIMDFQDRRTILVKNN